MKQEIERRLKILNDKKIPVVNVRMLRGGMQERLHRQEVLRYENRIRSQKRKLRDKLSSIIEQEKRKETPNGFGVQSFQSTEPMDDFHEPAFKRIRSKWGFF